MRVLVTGGAGYIGSGVVEELIRAGHGAAVYDSSVQGAPRGGARPRRRPSSMRTCSTREAAFARRFLESTPSCTWRQIRWWASRSPNPRSTTATTSSARSRCSRPCARSGVRAARLLLHLRDLRRARPHADRPRTTRSEPINPYGATKLAFEQALADYARRLRPAARQPALLQRRRREPGRRLGEDHDPETHLIPLVLQAGVGAAADSTVFGDDYPTPDGTCVRDYIHVSDLARRTCSRSRPWPAGARRRVQPGLRRRGLHREAGDRRSARSLRPRHPRPHRPPTAWRSGDPRGQLRAHRRRAGFPAAVAG